MTTKSGTRGIFVRLGDKFGSPFPEQPRKQPRWIRTVPPGPFRQGEKVQPPRFSPEWIPPFDRLLVQLQQSIRLPEIPIDNRPKLRLAFTFFFPTANSRS